MLRSTFHFKVNICETYSSLFQIYFFVIYVCDYVNKNVIVIYAVISDIKSLVNKTVSAYELCHLGEGL